MFHVELSRLRLSAKILLEKGGGGQADTAPQGKGKRAKPAKSSKNESITAATPDLLPPMDGPRTLRDFRVY
jgi:hypothetical protein